MRQRIIIIIIMCVFCASGIFGMVKKTTYTDITKEDNYLGKLQAGVLPGKQAVASCERIQECLPDVQIIIKGKVTGVIEHLFGVDRQKIQVEKVFKGSGIQEKAEVYVYSLHWTLSLCVQPSSIERGFVNIMDEGEEYLIFLSGAVVNTKEGILAYEVYDETLITPIFAYKDKAEIPAEYGTDDTFVPYDVVKDNELFCGEDIGYAAWKELKEKLFAQYS